jgi:hypothetical protein
MLASLDVGPLHAQVALLDATWQDYPEWDIGDEEVAYRASSLMHPESPPYPGFAVATRPDFDNGKPQKVRVELWIEDHPATLRLIHVNRLYVGRAGVEIGSDADSIVVDVPPGDWQIEIWVDGAQPSSVARVVFALTGVRS